MSKFWAGYLLGRRNDGSPPAGLVLLFAAFLGFIALLYVFKGIFNAIAGITQAQPLLSLLVVGTAAVILSRVVGTDSDLDAMEKIATPGFIVLFLFTIFWVIGEFSGASSIDAASLPVQVVMMGLSVAIVGGFVYMTYSLIRYKCNTPRGRAIRATSFLLLCWWGWISVFSLPLPSFPFLEAHTFLVLGVITTLSTGLLEAEI